MARLSQSATAAHVSTVIAIEAATPGTALPRLRLRSRSANRIGSRDDLRPDTFSTNQGMADTAARYSTTMVMIMPINIQAHHHVAGRSTTAIYDATDTSEHTDRRDDDR